MMMLTIGIYVMSIFLAVSLAHNGHHHGYPFIDKRSASSMLSINCNTSPQSECCTNIAYETWCEAPTSRAFCAEVNESGREEQCSPTSCSAGQTCYLSVPCKAHYSTACDDSDPCLAFPCDHDGTCINTGINMFTCNCEAGYDASTNCQEEINECDSNPCQNGGTCNDELNSYICTCSPGYTGTNCETEINECDSNPCQNGATCTDHVNGYTCTCVDGYKDTNCQTDIDECTSSPCKNGATCNDYVNSYSCTCVDGYGDTNCQTDIDECASDPCQNGATCHDHVNSYSCTCASGFDGSECGTDIDECNSSPCKNNASCVDQVNQYSCTCVSGYNGDDCEKDIDECDSNPCHNGGSCDDHVNSYNCTCVAGYIGNNCDTDENDCDSNPCQNGATCNDYVNRYSCTCASGYNGDNCETDINECDSDPCQNGATCYDHVDSYSCTCVDGYTGYNCDTGIEVYTRVTKKPSICPESDILTIVIRNPAVISGIVVLLVIGSALAICVCVMGRHILKSREEAKYMPSVPYNTAGPHDVNLYKETELNETSEAGMIGGSTEIPAFGETGRLNVTSETGEIC